jgi:hypothetical protein
VLWLLWLLWLLDNIATSIENIVKDAGWETSLPLDHALFEPISEGRSSRSVNGCDCS